VEISVRESQRKRWRILVILGLAAIVLGTWGSVLYLKGANKYAGIVDAAYRACQLFAFNLYDSGPLPWQLELARWLAPATTLGAIYGAAVAVLRRYDASWKLARLREHLLILYADPEPSPGARNRQVVFASVAEEESVSRAAGGAYRVTLASLSDLLDRCRAAHAGAVLAYARDEDEGIALAQGLCEACRAAHRAALPVTIVLPDSEMCSRMELLETNWEPELGLQVATPSEVLNGKACQAVAAALTRSSVEPEEPIRIVLDGSSPLCLELARRLCLLLQAAPACDVQLAVRCASPAADASEPWTLLRAAAPHIDWHLASSNDAAVCDTAQDDAGLRIFCAGSVGQLLDLLRRERESDMSDMSDMRGRNAPIALLRGDWRSSLALGAMLGDELAAVSADLEEEMAGSLLDPVLERLAMQIHEHYRQSATGVGPASLPWAELPARYRRSSRLQAEAIPFKLLALGIPMASALADIASVRLAIEARIEALAEAEHARWITEKRLSGWCYGPVRNDRLKRHPSLLPYAELSEGEKEKDRQMWRVLPLLLAAAGEV
jgi:hypothetical protein